MTNHSRRNAGCCSLLILFVLLVIVVPALCIGANLLVFDNPAAQVVADLLGIFGRPEPTPPPPPVVTIESIRRKADLVTVEYRTLVEVQNERVPDDFRQYFGAKERILLLVYGNVRAGFDLSKLKEEDLWRDGTRVQLHLPAPEILSISLDFERTHVVYHEKSLIVAHDPDLQGEALQTAKDAIRQAAMEAGILERAKEYGELFFENHLRSLGFTEVYVITN
jgi:hypothetical protein